MIRNACDTSLSSQPGTLPDVSGALQGWFQSLTCTLIVKTVVNYQVSEARTVYSFQGVRQPFTPQQLLMKPEGQRKWRWQTIHAEPTLDLTVDDVIEFNDVEYRVMQKNDFTEYGYVEYHVTEDYTS